MKEIVLGFPTQIIFGNGKINSLYQYLKPYGNKAFLAIDSYLAAKGLDDEIRTQLIKYGIDTLSYSDIDANPQCFSVDKAAKIAFQQECTMIIGIGGGSTIDFAKGVAVMAHHPGECWNYVRSSDHEMLHPFEYKTLPVIAIPTTAGTGSEVTPFAVFTNPLLKQKSTFISDVLYPKIALIDPELTQTVPPQITAFTGIDALSHAIESFVNRRANAFTKMVARESIRISSQYLIPVYVNGKNSEARGKMAWAAFLAGIAIAQGGTTLPHALAQPVSGYLNASHGGTVAACMMEIMRYSYESDLESFAEIAEAIDPNTICKPTHQKAEICSELVLGLFQKIDSVLGFKDFGLKEEDIEPISRIATTAYKSGIDKHPRRVNEDEIKLLYHKCMYPSKINRKKGNSQN